MKKKYEEIIRKYLHIQKKITFIDIDFAFSYPFLRPSWEQSYGQKPLNTSQRVIFQIKILKVLHSKSATERSL